MIATWWRPLTAEWLRISRRWDVWLVAGLVLASAAWLYVSTFNESTRIMGIGDQGGWGTGEGPQPEPWFLDAMLSLRKPYAFPESLLTILDSAWVMVPLGAYIAAVTIGPDFWWGTMRSILLARRSRMAYLAHRVALISALVAGVLVAILALAVVMQVLLLLFGGERFPAGSVQIDSLVGMLAARFTAALGFTLVAALLTLIGRSLAAGIVLIAVFVAAELGVGAIATAAGAPIVRELTFSGALASIVGQIRPRPLDMVVDYELGALVPAAQQPPAPVFLVDAEVSGLIVMVWVIAVAALAYLRMRTMDIAD